MLDPENSFLERMLFSLQDKTYFVEYQTLLLMSVSLAAPNNYRAAFIL